jgi:hypothetical protein
MPVDPRLTDMTLLGLAALRIKQRQQSTPPPGRRVTLQVVYADAPGEPPMPGYTVTYFLADGTTEWRRDDAT